jgi:hypothetical protein
MKAKKMKTARTVVHMLHDTAAAELHDPAAQFRQADRPELGVYLPAAHGKHTSAVVAPVI